MATYRAKVTTTGSAGSASGTALIGPLHGIVGYVKRDYNASAPPTTDYQLAEVGGAQRTIEAVANSATDALTYPTVTPTDNAGQPITGAQIPIFLDGVYLQVSVAQCNALTDALIVDIQVLN